MKTFNEFQEEMIDEAVPLVKQEERGLKIL